MCAAQWMQLREPFCEYGHHYNVEFITLEPSEFYPLVLLRFRAYLEVLSGLDKSAARNVFFVDLRDTLFQGDPFDPAVLPPSSQSGVTPNGELPYVLFTEEGDLEQNATIRDDEIDLTWVRPGTGQRFSFRGTATVQNLQWQGCPLKLGGLGLGQHMTCMRI